ncbi:hypothetical protein NIES2134_124720 [Thermostichus vulcanus NIES-2134]|nr:hypothetical protein NIES2134_124720 [Thermostichus vulcanus NIES-2134]
MILYNRSGDRPLEEQLLIADFRWCDREADKL